MSEADTERVRFTQRLENAIHARWAAMRAFWQGLKLAKASAFSVLFGLILFLTVPQAQDLFLEVRGTPLMDVVFWFAFYLAILVGWAFPVYVSSRWILSHFREGGPPGRVFVNDWVREKIPPLLAALCLAAVLAGQVTSLGNAPVFQEIGELEVHLKATQARCPGGSVASCGLVDYLASIPPLLVVLVAQLEGPDRVVLLLYVVFAVAITWVLARNLIRWIPLRPWRIAAAVLWWTVTVAVVVPLTALALFAVFVIFENELGRKLNLGHLLLLPFATILVTWALWWSLHARAGEPTRLANLLLRKAERLERSDPATGAARLLTGYFFALLAVSTAVILLLLVVPPADVTAYIYRALMLPFLLGLFVPVFTYLTYWSARWQAPLVITMVAVIALFAARNTDINDVRTVTTSSTRPTLEESVTRWAMVNECELGATEEARTCPPPIIVSAAGGASRAAFLSGGLIGKLLDERSVPAREGPGWTVGSALFTPDGRIITVSGGKNALLWDPATGKEIAAFEGHRFRLLSVSVSPDGRRVLTLSEDWSARLWEADTGKALAILKQPGQTRSAVFSPDSRRVLAAFSDGTARIFESESGRPLAVLTKHGGAVTGAQFSPDGQRVVTASADHTARIWDADSGKPIGAPLRGHGKPVTSAKFSADGQRILTASEDGTARLWNASSGTEIATLRGSESAALTASFSPDGRRVATLVRPSAVRLWDGENGKDLFPLKVATGEEIERVAFSPDSRRIVTSLGLVSGKAKLWDAESGREIAEFEGWEHPVISPDSKRIVRATRHSTMHLFDGDDGREIAKLEVGKSIRSVAFSSLGERIAVASSKQISVGSGDAIWLLDAKSGNEISNFDTFTNQREKDVLSLRPFGKQLFAISSVSGGALGAVVTYAALADSQIEESASNGLGHPPCVKSYRDNQWFAPFVNPSPPDQAAAPPEIWSPSVSWRGCLQLVLAGDFLSPVFVSLISDDLLQIGRRGDRSVALEQGWEMRYAQMTGQHKAAAGQPKVANPPPVTTLAEPLIGVRRRVLDADPQNWLPILLLNGTSVTTGRRIVASDVNTRTEEKNPIDRKINRVFTDAYDFHELLSGNERGLVRETADIRLTTGATLSARFPILSPHGNIRASKDRKMVDRVVDGGYYENFGAITSLELVRVLRGYGLKPFVIVVNNEPLVSGMDCVTDSSRLPRPEAPATVVLSTLSSPLNALLGTGTGRALHATVQLCSDVGSDNFAFITVKRDEHNSKKALSMSWWLSMHVQKYLDDQLDAKGINMSAFQKITTARR